MGLRGSPLIDHSTQAHTSDHSIHYMILSGSASWLTIVFLSLLSLLCTSRPHVLYLKLSLSSGLTAHGPNFRPPTSQPPSHFDLYCTFCSFGSIDFPSNSSASRWTHLNDISFFYFLFFIFYLFFSINDKSSSIYSLQSIKMLRTEMTKKKTEKRPISIFLWLVAILLFFYMLLNCIVFEMGILLLILLCMLTFVSLGWDLIC